MLQAATVLRLLYLGEPRKGSRRVGLGNEMECGRIGLNLFCVFGYVFGKLYYEVMQQFIDYVRCVFTFRKIMVKFI